MRLPRQRVRSLRFEPHNGQQYLDPARPVHPLLHGSSSRRV